QVARVQHQLEREQDDQRAAPQQHSERPGREHERRHTQIPGDVGTLHSSASSCRRRACAPRTTPPTAAISSTTEVVSKASRWSVRNSRPIWAGLPKLPPILAACESWPPALSPSTTSTSTRIAAAAATAATRYTF